MILVLVQRTWLSMLLEKKIKRLLSKVNVFVEGRLLEDDGNVLISLEDNIEGTLMTSQIATGEENDLKIRVWGDKGGILRKHSTPIL